MKIENDFKLNLINLTQPRSLVLMLLCGAGLVFGGNSVYKVAEDAKTLKQIDASSAPGKEKFMAARQKTILSNSLLTFIAFTIVYVFNRGLFAAKRQNDAASVRIARRYLKQIRNQYPELKQYDAVLDNDVALHNIAAGVANKLSLKQIIGFGDVWEWTRGNTGSDKHKSIDELKIINRGITNVIDELKKHSESDPEFAPYLEKLVASSATTFFLNPNMIKSKVR